MAIFVPFDDSSMWKESRTCELFSKSGLRSYPLLIVFALYTYFFMVKKVVSVKELSSGCLARLLCLIHWEDVRLVVMPVAATCDPNFVNIWSSE